MIGGGSTTVDGPKNVGISLLVVTGVFKSPVCASDEDCVTVALSEPALPPLVPPVFNKLRWVVDVRPLTDVIVVVELLLPPLVWCKCA